VTTVVHVTEGPDSQFPALYIPVIAVSAVLMPFTSSMLVTILAMLLYLADIIWWQQPVALPVVVWLQMAVFVGVFIATGLIASRVRVVGAEREELRREVRRLRLEASDILRNIRSGIVTVDGDGRLLYANPAAAELLGLTLPVTPVRPLAELVGDAAPELLRTIGSAYRGEERVVRSEGWVRLPGRAYPIGVTATRIELDTLPPSVTAIFTDISDQKRLEELHLRAGRLEAVAELSASLAHEIRNPLASIRTSVEQLAGAAGAGKDQRFLAELVVRESDRLSRLLNEFLDFARVQVTHKRPVDLARVVADAVETVRAHPEWGAEARIELIGQPVTMDGDEDLLHRVALNLVLNAVQACADRRTDGPADERRTGGPSDRRTVESRDHRPAGPPVRRSTGRVLVEVRQALPQEIPSGLPRQTLLLRVSDDGPGIPPQVRGRLFQPFVSGRPGGSGLGLAIVQRAVEAHGGVALVDSAGRETGKGERGTVFSVFLPAAAASEAVA
jgi:two-component system sensor histidine kinase PilS (NtrC family)